MADAHLAQMFFDRADKQPSKAILKYRHRGAPYADLSFAKAKERVLNIAAGLLTAPGGLEMHQSVTIFANTRLEWVLCDFAVLALGGKAVPIYASLLTPEVGYIQQDCQAVITIVEGKEHLEKVREAQQGFTFFDKDYPADAIKVRHIVVLDPDGIEPADDWESLADLEQRGAEQLKEQQPVIEDRGGKIRREDVCTYVYTSGTTGPPKGAIQSHNNHFAIFAALEQNKMFAGDATETGAFLFLPLAHSFGRMIEWAAVYFEAPLILSAPDTLLEDLQATRPGVFPAAPRVYEKIYSRIQSGLPDAPPLRQKLFHWATGIGGRVHELRENGKEPSGMMALEFKLADKLVLSKIRSRLGLERCAIMGSGSAPLSKEVQLFFGAASLPIMEGYGLTETCPVLTLNAPDAWRTGTVGKAIAGVELKIAEDGEILARGDNVVSGYLNRQEATEEAFNDGWFHTGDIGEIDKDGFVRITDRKKDLIITAGGKNIAPQKIEGKLKNHPLIFEAAVIGDQRKYCVALIAVDEEALETWAARTGNPKDPHAKPTLDAIQEGIDALNKELASFESIKYFRLIDEAPSVDNGMLTASFKLKRRVVAQRYAGLIEEMYSDHAKAA